MTRRLLFIHGAGGETEDRALAHELGATLDASVDYPQFTADDMSMSAWAGPIRAGLSGLGARDLVVGHSFGASALLHVLAQDSWTIAPVVLLAMPDWGPRGWDVAEYAFGGPEPEALLTLHHCRDDDVVSFDHLALNSALLPSARVFEHDAGGHQFDGLADRITRPRAPG